MDKTTKEWKNELQKRHTKNHPEVMTRENLRHRAKTLGIPFELTGEDIRKLFDETKVCPIFGKRLSRGVGLQHDWSPSIDRIDYTKGYVLSNVRVLSWRANNLRKNATAAELIALALDAAKIEMEKKSNDARTV
jgi:hypothetical protein